jgi:hypothetical protein
MNFSGLKHLFRKEHHAFDNISGYADVKDVVNRALVCEDSFNLLLCAPPASAKTLFLLGIQELGHNAVYFDTSNTSNTAS